MMHKPIAISNLCLSFPEKCCFENFSCQIPHGNRIAIIGRNGIGKSTLLKILQQQFQPTSGEVLLTDDVNIGYVQQTIEDFAELSGGQRLNRALTQALSKKPNVLLLDEPTNHLDQKNRKSLIRMLQGYAGTLIIVTHDRELLRTCVDTLWHINNNQIHIFSGFYDDYMCEIKRQRQSIEQSLLQLKRQKKDTHTQLMQEQQRAAKSRSKGKKSISMRKWPTVVSPAKAHRSSQTSGKKKSDINKHKQDLENQLADLQLPEIILPQFSLTANQLGSGTLIAIHHGAIGYNDEPLLLQNISLSVYAHKRIAIKGDNGSGKSTLIRAILAEPTILRTGDWYLPKPTDIGYLDQHYANLNPNHAVLDTLTEVVPEWSNTTIRRHLSDFLFQTNEAVSQCIKDCSGGEKARLSLALIAAITPKLLILDEMTNNLDLETKEYVTQILKAYPGAMLVISHDEDFLTAIGIDQSFEIQDGTINQV